MPIKWTIPGEEESDSQRNNSKKKTYTEEDYGKLLDNIEEVANTSPYSLKLDEYPVAPDWRDWIEENTDVQKSSKTRGSKAERVPKFFGVTSDLRRPGDSEIVDNFIDEVIEDDISEFNRVFSEFTDTSHYRRLSMNKPMNYESDETFNVLSGLAHSFDDETDILGRPHYRIDMDQSDDGEYLQEVMEIGNKELENLYRAAMIGADLSESFSKSIIYIDKEVADEYGT